MERPTREQMIEKVADAALDAWLDDPADIVRDVILYGHKGLHQETDDELWEQYQDLVGDEEEEQAGPPCAHCGKTEEA